MKNTVYTIIIAFLIVLLYRAECGRPIDPPKEVKVDGKKYEIIKVKLDTVYIKVKPEVVFKDRYVADTVIVTKIDTLSCEDVKVDYYSKKVFLDTIKFGSSGNIYIKDTIQRNSLSNRTVNSDLVFANPREFITVKEKAKNELYFGPRIDFSGGVVTPHIGLLLKTTRNRLYGVSLGVGRSPIYSGSIYIKF